MLDRFGFDENDMATYLYEDLRIDLLNICRQRVVYIQVVRDRMRDLEELSGMLEGEITDDQFERLCELNDKYSI